MNVPSMPRNGAPRLKRVRDRALQTLFRSAASDSPNNVPVVSETGPAALMFRNGAPVPGRLEVIQG